MKLQLRSKFTGLLAVAVATSGLAAGLSGSTTAGAASGNTTMICANGTLAPDGATEFALEARDGYIAVPDGDRIYTWSYSEVGAAFQFPGPTLCVDEGETVRVTFTNPAHLNTLVGGIPADNTSIIFPGQSGVVATGGVAGLMTQEVEANSGDTVTYQFVASAPGTYMYQSGTDQAVQVQMGMFGGFIVYPTAGRNFAYPGKEFDPENEYLLLFHEFDPEFHAHIEHDSGGTIGATGLSDAVVLANYNPLERHNRYWTINGRSFPDTIAENNTPVLPSQPYGSLVQINADDPNDAYNQLPSLVRYGNAGLDNHAFHPHGNHLVLIAQDGRLLPDEIESYTKTVAAGQTFDILAAWHDVEAWQGSTELTVVNFPALKNLTYKDGVTWYSGSPNLGQQQQLPSSVLTYSACGEYYFPWHSHALNEVQNFDAGFGGMLTLWRVDPPKVLENGNWVSPAGCR